MLIIQCSNAFHHLTDLAHRPQRGQRVNLCERRGYFRNKPRRTRRQERNEAVSTRVSFGPSVISERGDPCVMNGREPRSRARVSQPTAVRCTCTDAVAPGRNDPLISADYRIATDFAIGPAPVAIQFSRSAQRIKGRGCACIV